MVKDKIVDMTWELRSSRAGVPVVEDAGGWLATGGEERGVSENE